MKVMKQLAMVAAVTAFSVAGASAALLNYVVESGTVQGAALSDPGLEIEYAVAGGLAGRSFWLNDTDEETFNFFHIWTDEGYVQGDDLIERDISATLNFSDPSVGGTVGGGSGVDLTWVLIGFIANGAVTWNNPGTVTLADRQFEISLSNETFNESWSLFGTDLNPGSAHGATVQATVKQVWGLPSNPDQNVPDGGATLALLGLGLAGLGIFRRK